MAQPHARSASSAQPDPRAPTTAETSWFCCGAGWGPCGSAGGGACGNCQSGSRHCAWPNTSDNCFAITRPDTCGNTLLRRTCGHTFYVKHLCGSTEIAVTIADCGPQTDLWCGEQSCCSGNCGKDRLLDLTPSAYSAIGNLSSGIMPVTIRS